MARSITPGFWSLDTERDSDAVVLDLNATHRAVLDITAALPFLDALVNDAEEIPLQVLTLKTVYSSCWGCDSCDQEGWFDEDCQQEDLVVDPEVPAQEVVLDLSDETTRHMFAADLLEYNGFSWMTYPGADGQ